MKSTLSTYGLSFVIPAEAGIQRFLFQSWIPVFTGMTILIWVVLSSWSASFEFRGEYYRQALADHFANIRFA